MKRLLLVGLLVFAGCSGNADIPSISRYELRTLVESRGVKAPAIIVPYRLTPEMRKWTHSVVPKHLDADGRLLHLTRILLDPSKFGLSYEKQHTATAEEVFESRRANCLAFTNLFVGMARELGVPVYFLEVRDVVTYEKHGDLVVVSDHVAVGNGPNHAVQIIDFAGNIDDDNRYHRVHRITDLRAISMYYSNRGAEYLRQGDAVLARGWLRTAVAVDPEYPASWVNYGVSLRRSGDSDGAERAYRKALELDLHSGSALQNLAALLQARGEHSEAFDLLALSDRDANRNPYTYLTLGDLSMRHGKMDEAGRFYRKALRRGVDQAEPLAAMGLWELHQGAPAKARRLLAKAQEIDPSSNRVVLLRTRLMADET